MNERIPEKVAQKLDSLPTAPGCYQMLDKEGRVLYVGKAVVSVSYTHLDVYKRQ